MKPRVGISLMPEKDFVDAALPLFEKGEIGILEWSFDMIPPGKKEPEWVRLLLETYSTKNSLLGHGVRYSMLNGAWDHKQSVWLKQLAAEVKKYQYRHITEHFGFMTSDDFHKGAPLPLPLNETSLKIGHDRLKRLQATAQLPVGIENLAFAFNREEVKRQGEFLEKLIRPVNGFLILDLHNIWCQAMNFQVDALEIVRSYPLDKVKEIHISGGSWVDSVYTTRKKKIRRDTHDEAIPAEVFMLLEKTLPLCPYVEAIIFERLGNTISSVKEKEQLRKDFRQIKKIVSANKILAKKGDFKALDHKDILNTPPLEDKMLKTQQDIVVKTLTEAMKPEEAIDMLNENPLLIENNWKPGNWSDYMVETAMQLIKKWN